MLQIYILRTACAHGRGTYLYVYQVILVSANLTNINVHFAGAELAAPLGDAAHVRS